MPIREIHDRVVVDEPAERSGFWSWLGRTTRRVLVWTGVIWAIDRVESWFRSGSAGDTMTRAGNWIADTAIAGWSWTKNLFRRTPPAVARTAATPFVWFSWAGLWTVAGIAGGLALIVRGIEWMSDRWETRVHRPVERFTRRIPQDDVREVVVHHRTEIVDPDAANKIVVHLENTDYSIEPFKAGDNIGNAYDWRSMFGVDSEQDMVDLLFTEKGQGGKVPMDRINSLSPDSEKLRALSTAFDFAKSVGFDKQVTSEWFGRGQCFGDFTNDGPQLFFNTDKARGMVRSLQERVDNHSKAFTRARNNHDKRFANWFHQPAFQRGYQMMYRELMETYAPTGASV